MLGFGRPKQSPEFQKQRQSAIDSFLRAQPSARAINADSSVFEVPINTIYGRLAINV